MSSSKPRLRGRDLRPPPHIHVRLCVNPPCLHLPVSALHNKPVCETQAQDSGPVAHGRHVFSLWPTQPCEHLPCLAPHQRPPSHACLPSPSQDCGEDAISSCLPAQMQLQLRPCILRAMSADPQGPPAGARSRGQPERARSRGRDHGGVSSQQHPQQGTTPPSPRLDFCLREWSTCSSATSQKFPQ